MDRIEYYNSLIKNASTTPEQKSLAEAMKTKERINKLVSAWGIPRGAAVGWAAGHPFAGAGIGATLSRANNWLWDKGLEDAKKKYNFIDYDTAFPKQQQQARAQGRPQQVTQRPNRPSASTIATANDIANEVALGSKPLEGGVSQEQQVTPQLVDDYINRIKEANKPYTQLVQDYANNYNDLVNRNFNAQRYFTAMAGLTGNQGYTKLADALNPINNEANRINAMKIARDAELSNINAINEAMGNLALAQEMGLPSEAAFANKNLLTMMAAKEREANRYQIALENNLMKKYGIDRNYARALAVQAMRGQVARDVANINAAAYGTAPGLNRQGTAQQGNEQALFQQVLGK
jgi:hypothetical protein